MGEILSTKNVAEEVEELANVNIEFDANDVNAEINEEENVSTNPDAVEEIGYVPFRGLDFNGCNIGDNGAQILKVQLITNEHIRILLV